MKSPIVVTVEFDAIKKGDTIQKGLGDRPVLSGNESLDGVKYALVWQVDPDLFDRMPNLEVIFSAGAGVDKILASSSIPDVPIVRFVDSTLTNRMSEWICLQCLIHLRQQQQYDRQQREKNWTELQQPEAREICVGVMGMGVLGQDAARKLSTLGFEVIGWSRSRKQVDGIQCFDQAELETFLSRTDILVGLLPSTPQTTGMFNRSIFEKLRRDSAIRTPVFINAGRGQSQDEADLVACLQDGTLGGASLDVFQIEPLPVDSPLWEMENTIITPHIAASSDVVALGRYVDQQIMRYEAGRPLENLVDRNLGY